MIMLVEFYRTGEGRLCGWIAAPPHRRPFQGSTMAAGRDLPHDLTQFTIERALEIRDGFWGVLAHGGWFPGMPGRRPTPQGRAIVRAHHARAGRSRGGREQSLPGVEARRGNSSQACTGRDVRPMARSGRW